MGAGSVVRAKVPLHGRKYPATLWMDAGDEPARKEFGMARDGSKVYFSERGEIACGEHAPYPGTDTFRWERWRIVTPAIAAEWARQGGGVMKCETCGKAAA